MGKVRKVVLGDEKYEQEQKKKAEARREGKKAKKAHSDDGKSKGGDHTQMIEGTELKGEVREILKEIEKGEKPTDAKAMAGKAKKIGVARVRSKRYQEAVKLVDKNTTYTLKDAIPLMKKTSLTQFDGTVEIHINLNPATMNGKTDMRGSVTLPHGTGKKIRVVIADDAILAEIEKGVINFDVLVAHPSMMPKLAKVAKILGPKGLMPNPKTGTVTPDVEKRVKELSQGQVNFKTEPDNPIIHMSIGKVSFEDKQLMENIQAVILAIGKGKIAKATITATMGPGVRIMIS